MKQKFVKLNIQRFLPRFSLVQYLIILLILALFSLVAYWAYDPIQKAAAMRDEERIKVVRGTSDVLINYSKLNADMFPKISNINNTWMKELVEKKMIAAPYIDIENKLNSRCKPLDYELNGYCYVGDTEDGPISIVLYSRLESRKFIDAYCYGFDDPALYLLFSSEQERSGFVCIANQDYPKFGDLFKFE